MKVKIAVFLAATVSLALPARAQGIPPILQGIYKQCQSDCMQRVEQGTVRGAPKSQAPLNERAGFCKSICYCTTERMGMKSLRGIQRGDNREIAAIENGCIAEYTPPATGGTKLTRQTISQAGSTYALNPSARDMSKEDSDLARLNRAPILECRYRGTGVNFWHREVPLPPARLKQAAGRKHELIATLGHTGVNACPQSLAEAEELKSKVLRQSR